MKPTLKFSTLVLTILLLASCIGSGEISEIKDNGKGYFPSLTGIDLLGEKREIPEAFEGDLNIITVGFEREHQLDINTWINVADEILSEHSNIKFYEVPLIYEINGAYRMWINNGMRRGIPDEKARERTITVYTDREKFTSILDMKTDRIYALLLDSSGKILWKEEGRATTAKILKLKSKI